MKKSEIKKLFENMCCSSCGNDFEESSFSILREEECFCVIQVICIHCNKSFGLAFLGYKPLEEKEKEFEPLDIIEGLPPISYDDVINAHNFIKKMDKDWTKHIPKDFKTK